MTARLICVNIATSAQVLRGPWTGRVGRSGIGKQPVSDRITTGADQLTGDTICDTAHHGGRDQAVYAYAIEDARWWSSELGRDVAPGAFGENFTTEGLDLTEAVIGQRLAIGTAVFEVSCPRIPCRTFAGFWDEPRLIKRFTRAGRPGAYLRIHTPGSVGAGDAIETVHIPEHGVTILETFRAISGDRRLAARLLDAPELPEHTLASARIWSAQPSA